ncbi:hypothetical protein NDU88_003247 [Pleurodeles waltl]|uniref:Uncharacterized protein n=1 Tax=Pleurodeles waltl TaxID=8319 RepID=A0AAV7RCC4_PLEWA|nr:hypothetical protein NDU88_003247 [Pleurodeles waltl]
MKTKRAAHRAMSEVLHTNRQNVGRLETKCARRHSPTRCGNLPTGRNLKVTTAHCLEAQNNGIQNRNAGREGRLDGEKRKNISFGRTDVTSYKIKFGVNHL